MPRHAKPRHRGRPPRAEQADPNELTGEQCVNVIMQEMTTTRRLLAVAVAVAVTVVVALLFLPFPVVVVAEVDAAHNASNNKCIKEINILFMFAPRCIRMHARLAAIRVCVSENL